MSDPERIDLTVRIAALNAEMGIFADERWRAAGRAIGLEENFLLSLDKERKYKAAKTQFEQYHHWQQTRNAERAEGEALHGYDVKHGAHLYRLLKMCREILLTGEVHVWRGGRDVAEIHAIRNGEWPYEALVGWAKECDAELTEIYVHKRYVVPDAPDRAAIEALCVELVERSLQGE